MSSYEPQSTGATTVDPPPHWIPAAPPWEPYAEPEAAGEPGSPPVAPPDGGWQPPPAGPGGWHPDGWQPEGWQPEGWQPGAWQPGAWQQGGWPPPPAPGRSPAPPGRPGRARIAILAVAMLIAALVGVGIGSRIHPTTSVPAATAVPIAPSTPSPGVSPTTPSSGNPGGSASSSSSGGTATAAQASAIAAKVNPAIVDINTQLGYQNGAGAGTGMILTSTGEILTNNHVVDGATSISVTLVSTGRSYPATVVGTDRADDIAVLQIKGVSGLKTIQTSSSVSVGDPVIAIGNAGGTGGTPAVVTGNIQAVGQTITASDQGGANAETLTGLIQIDAPIQPGDSGGPLVNTSAQVIGIDTAASSAGRFRSGATVGFAIPIDKALSIAHEIEAGHASSTIHIGLPGFLGVSISSTSSAGAVVTTVQPGSPAAGAGLVPGSAITSLGGQPVDSATSLSTLTRAHHPGDKVSLGWTDQAGAKHTANVTLATGPAD